MTMPLEHLTIIDLSYRLPGPLAGKILADLGAKVIKVEDTQFLDPFIKGLFSTLDPSFPKWYEGLNENKEVIRLDFNSPTIKAEFKKILDGADGILLAMPKSIQKKLGLDLEALPKRTFSVVELLASKHHQYAMHDLNALALSGLLSLHTAGKNEAIIEPPFLPIAGINFGSKVATDLLASLHYAKTQSAPHHQKTYLYESTQEIFDLFWPEDFRKTGNTKFLHNGLYPCYGIYKTKDNHYVALAAVEEKYWKTFTQLFQLDLSTEQRFSTNKKISRTISDKLGSLNAIEIQETIQDHDFCMTLF